MSNPWSNWTSYGLAFVGTIALSPFREARNMTSFWNQISDDGKMPCLLASLDVGRFGHSRACATVSHHVVGSGITDTYPNRPETFSGRRVASYSS